METSIQYKLNSILRQRYRFMSYSFSRKTIRPTLGRIAKQQSPVQDIFSYNVVTFCMAIHASFLFKKETTEL